MGNTFSKSEYLSLYAQYMNSNISITDFCKEQELDYLSFVSFINRWEKNHGSDIVSKAMEQTEVRYQYDKGKSSYRASRAERMFKPLVVEPDTKRMRSRKRFPDDPSFLVELSSPTPNTILKDASITFPSGASINFKSTTIKDLILAVVMYEEYEELDFGPYERP